MLASVVVVSGWSSGSSESVMLLLTRYNGSIN
jgi:hypothetical protein